VFFQAQQAFALFDQLMQSAQHRRITLLREVATVGRQSVGNFCRKVQ
jgi:hypothetical protein